MISAEGAVYIGLFPGLAANVQQLVLGSGFIYDGGSHHHGHGVQADTLKTKPEDFLIPNYS